MQDVGKVITKEDRCIAFPNLYQHLVSPFRLADPTKPGHRKILVFFLVDPHFTIPSASVVAPQQAPWKPNRLVTLLCMRPVVRCISSLDAVSRSADSL